MATLKKLLPYQSAFLQAPCVYDSIRYFMLITGYGAGKGQPLYCKVLTVKGFKPMGEIKVGDKIISPTDGKPYEVDGIYNKGLRKGNKITVSNGAVTYCDDFHLWNIQSYKDSARRKGFKTVDMEYLHNIKLVKENGTKTTYIPITNCVDFTDFHDDFAYAVGLFIGDGCCARSQISINEHDVRERFESLIAEKGYYLTGNDPNTLYVSSNFNKPKFARFMKEEYGIEGNAEDKRIPEKLLYADRKTRLALLEGLLYSVGTVESHGNTIDYCCTSKGLTEDIYFLASSLGFVVSRRKTREPFFTYKGETRKGRTAYRITFRYKDCLNLSEKHISRISSKAVAKDRIAIVNIEQVEEAVCQCIHINSPDHLYITDDWIVTHNTSSLVDSLCYDISRLQGKRDREGRSPLLMLAGVTLTFMKRTCVHDLLQALDNTKTFYKYHKDINQIEMGDVTLVIQAVEDPSTIYGLNCAAIYWDECDELPAEIMMEATRSLNERLRQQLVGERSPYAKWTTTSQGLKGLYQTVMQFKDSGVPYMIIRARTKDNIYLPKEYVDSMYAMYNEKERRCFLEGEFLSVDSGLVFPDYNPAKNDLAVDLYDSLNTDDVVYISQDFNQNNNNAQAFVVKSGAIVMIKDYIFPDIRRSPEVLRYDFPDQKIIWIPDMTYKEHFGEFKKELRQHKINIAYRACNPNVTDRNFAVNKCLYSERLFICPCCEDSKKSLMTHQIDPKTLKPMKGGIGAPDHKSDCLGMAVHYLLSWHKDLKDIYKLTLGRRYMYRDDPSLRLGNRVVSADSILRGKLTGGEDLGEISD